jgi:hypothetical protein
MCYALLLCKASVSERTQMLYNLLQDGGRSVNPYISAGDKDIYPIFAKLCSLATLDLFNFMENAQTAPATIVSSLPSQPERK